MTGRIERARELLRRADRIVVLTGAGVSAESGVPTFRGAGGLWKSHRPEDLATPEAFQRDPRLVWEWYAWRRGLISQCEPNEAHRALARLALGDRSVTIVTQNVDGLHHRAAEEVASPDERPAAAYPLEVHGAIHRDRCVRCGTRMRGQADVDTSSTEALPTCDSCGGSLRPDVVWFGEALDPEILEASLEAARTAQVCLVVGTSAAVYPAASVPEVTLRSGGDVIEVNTEPTPLSGLAGLSLQGPAGELVPELVGSSQARAS